MNNKRIIRLIAEISLILLVVIIFVVINWHIRDKEYSSFNLIDDSSQYAYQVENIAVEDDELIISGWFFRLNKFRNEIKELDENSSWGIVLYDLSSEIKTNADGSEKSREGLVMSVEKGIKRSDVNNYFKCEYDYSSCGFKASIKTDRIDLKDGEYQIVFKPEDKGKDGLNSSAYIDHGKLSYIDPKDTKTLNVKDTDLEDIVNNGYCVASFPTVHIYVYQYNKKIYWIAEEGYSFNAEGKTYIQYQLDTTQFEKLPASRTDNGWYWGNIGAEFELFEITDSINCGEYRVSTRDIPDDYSLVSIYTGYFNEEDKMIWDKLIRPVDLYK